MGTIFVAYGEPGHRNRVLEFAVEQAAASEHELFVYHIQEHDDESAKHTREEIAGVIERTDPTVTADVRINTRSEPSDLTNVSKRALLTEAILESDRNFEYVVMGDVERDTLEGLAHASMTEAVLETHAIPVLLVPV
ncbi:MAG: universal stress protein [Halodesulfurarchaeum sp.]